MAQIAFLERKCTGCGLCVENCPFGAIDIKDGHPELNAACKVCGICVKNCPEKAILKLETKVENVDKSQWNDILVFSEVSGGRLHPVSLELIGKARELAAPLGFKVKTVLVGDGVSAFAEELRHYGVSEIAVYDDPALGYFRADAYASCVEDYIKHAKPSVVLVGATSLGRSLAPRLSTRFHTGLTADCTKLELRENTDLVQIRPAFGGNLTAEILCRTARPQMASVRPGVFPIPQPVDGRDCALRPLKLAPRPERLERLSFTPAESGVSLQGASVIVTGGKGVGSKKGFEKLEELAALLGGGVGATRSAVDAGWISYPHQIGQTGITVRPRLYLAFGVSGLVQHTVGMSSSGVVVAVNRDRNAPIFACADYGIVADWEETIDEWIQYVKERKQQA